MVAFSLYFLQKETQQLMKEKLGYFSSIWNFMDIVIPVFTILYCILEQFGVFNIQTTVEIDGEMITVQKYVTLQASLQATLSLFIWMKFLYFLRIFKQSGYLIRIIIEVVKDMRFFLLILFLTFIAFGDSMYRLSSKNINRGE